MVPVTTTAIRLIALLGLAAVWLCLSCTAALAHAGLTETEPRAEEALSSPPDQVWLRFSEPVEAAFNPLEVRNSRGERADEDDARLDPDDARVLVADLKELPADTYEVEWRVTSVDGHVIGDTFDFTVTASDVSELPSDVEADATSESGTNWIAIAGILSLVIVAVLGVTTLSRKRRTTV